MHLGCMASSLNEWDAEYGEIGIYIHPWDKPFLIVIMQPYMFICYVRICYTRKFIL